MSNELQFSSCTIVYHKHLKKVCFSANTASLLMDSAWSQEQSSYLHILGHTNTIVNVHVSIDNVFRFYELKCT